MSADRTREVHWLLDDFKITPEDLEFCRDKELNLLFADLIRLQGEAGVLEEKLERGKALSPEQHERYIERLLSRGRDGALRKLLPRRRRYGLVELAVYGWWADMGVPVQLGVLPVFMEEMFGISEDDAAELISDAISEPSDAIAGVYIGPKDVVERVLEIEIHAAPPVWVGELIVTDYRVWVSAEAQAMGLLAERWSDWTELRALGFAEADAA